MKKLLSNKGSSTLTTAIILFIILSSLALITTLIVGRNASISVKKVNSKYEYVLLENDLYDELNNKLLNNEENDESTNGYSLIWETDENGNYTVVISNNTYKISATVEFSSLDYKILRWSKESVWECLWGFDIYIYLFIQFMFWIIFKCCYI